MSADAVNHFFEIFTFFSCIQTNCPPKIKWIRGKISQIFNVDLEFWTNYIWV